MNVTPDAWTCSPKPDIQTGLSLGLSLLATITTILVLGILAHHEYISLTIAYSATPAIGTTLLLVGAAIALIRKENRPLTPSSIPLSIDQNTPCSLQTYTDGSYIKICAPDKTRPYWFCMAQLSDGDKVSEIEVDYFTQGAIYFIRDNSCESKPLLLTPAVENEFKSFERTLIENNYLDRLNYRWLMGEQVGTMRVGRGSACFFNGSSTTHSMSSYSIKFCIPNLDLSQPYVHQKNKITFRLKEGSPPIRSLQGLENHKEVIKKLQATEWTWYCPGQITKIKQLGTKAFDVCYTYDR